MLRLDSSVVLQAVLSGAISTTQPQVTVCASDQSSSGYAGLAPVRTALNSTTDVTILSAPAASTFRDVDYLSVYNRDTASITVTIKYDASGTDTIIITATILTLETLFYVHGQGWGCLDAQGRFKTAATFSGTLAATSGGTGFASYTIGDLLYADTAASLAKLADVATGNALISGGVGTAPSWGKIGLTTHVTGTLPVANGGTGTTTATGTAGSVVLSAGPTITGTLTATGLIDISGASAGQIKFPATQNASSDANTLDDYEEGTFTPGFAFGGGTTGITYSVQVGKYIKIGSLVQVQGRILTTNKGSSTGVMTITGLPFTATSTTNAFCAICFRTNGLTGISGGLQSYISPSGTVINVGYSGTGTFADAMDTNATNSTDFFIAAVYEV